LIIQNNCTITRDEAIVKAALIKVFES